MTVNNQPVLLIDVADDEQYFIDIVQSILQSNGLPACRSFRSPQQYKEAINTYPDLKADILITDYRFTEEGTNELTGVDIMIIAKSRNKFVKGIMISDFTDSDVHDDFFHAGGNYWVKKSRKDFQTMFTSCLQKCIEQIIDNRAIKAQLQSMDGPTLTRDRQPLSYETDIKTYI